MDGSHSLLIRTAVWHSDAARGPSTPSFDHLVGAREQRIRHGKTERPCGRQVDDQIELGRLLDREISWTRPAQYLVDKVGGTSEGRREVRSIGHQTACFHILSIIVHCW